MNKAAMVAIVLLSALTVASGTERVKAHPIVVEGALVGGLADGRWVDGEAMMAFTDAGESYTLYSLNKRLGTAAGGMPEMEEGSGCVRVDIESKANYTAALAAPWDAMPRKVRKLSVKSKTYLSAVRSVLREKGMGEAPVHIYQILRADLEGDGKDEVVIAAGSFAPGHIDVDSTPKTWSFVILRKIVGGQVKTFILDSWFPTASAEESPPLIFRVAGILDLDGDGSLEILLGNNYYEGEGWSVHKFVDGKVQVPLSFGCGL